MPGATKVNQSFFEVTERRLNNVSILKLFDILEDVDRSTKFMNLFKSVSPDDDKKYDVLYYDTYEAPNDAWWDNISYEAYGTPLMWWIVAIMNDATNPYEDLEPGQNLRVLKDEHLQTLFKDIDRISKL